MAIIAEVSWDAVVAGTLPESHFRKAFRRAVQEVAEKAREALPEANGRIDSAVKLVLQGDVLLSEDRNSATVASRSNGTTEYFVTTGECQCKDFPNAPGNFCAHRLAYGIAKRGTALAEQRLEAQSQGTAPAPVSPESASPAAVPETVNIPQSIPPQFIVELHGKQFITFGGLLAMAHGRGLVSLKADFITVTAELALAHAVATFQDGRTFEESADATPANVKATIRLHFPRMALTRSKARCLRDALNIPLVCLEELEG